MPFCFTCGAQIGEGDSSCGKCGAKLVPVVPQPAEAVVTKGISGKLIAGGISGILAGVASLLMGIFLVLVAITESVEYVGGPMGGDVMVVGAIIGIILGILGITGCSYALARKSFRFGLAGAVCAFLATISSWSFILVVPVLLGIAAIVLIALSRSDFRKE